jgi:hypothetical protein
VSLRANRYDRQRAEEVAGERAYRVDQEEAILNAVGAQGRAALNSRCVCRLPKGFGALDQLFESRLVRVARLAGMNNSDLATLRRLDQLAVRTGV